MHYVEPVAKIVVSVQKQTNAFVAVFLLIAKMVKMVSFNWNKIQFNSILDVFNKN